MSDDPRDPELEHLLDLVVDLVLDRVRGSEIGQVTSFDEGTQVATVQPVVRRASIGETGARVTRVTPPLRCLVFYPGGSGGRLTAGLRAGDYGLLLYSSVALGRWKTKGGIVDPMDDRRHDPTDAVFLPGIHPAVSPPTSAPSADLVAHARNGGKFKAGGPTGTEPTFKAPTFLTALDTLVDSIASAVGGLPGGAGAAAAIRTALTLFQSTPVRSPCLTSDVEVR